MVFQDPLLQRAAGVTVLVRGSEGLDGKGKHIASAALGTNNARCTRIGLQFAAQPQDLHVDAAVENILVHPSRLQQMLAAERPLGCVEKGGQQSIFTLGQRDLGSVGVGEAPGAPIELPAAELAPAALRIPLRRGASGFLPSQHGADAGQKFPKAEWLGHIVVRAQFQPDHPVDLVASITGRYDYRNIGARSDLAQQVEPVLLAKPEVEDDEIRLACGEMMDQLLPPPMPRRRAYCVARDSPRPCLS